MAISVGNRTGKVTRKIRVTTNDRENQQAVLECVADVKSALALRPSRVNFGNIERDDGPMTREITITKGDGGPISPKVIRTGSNNITAELEEIEAGEEYKLTVTASPPWPNRMVRGNLQIETGVEKSPRERITVYGRITPRLTAIPSRFTLPRDIQADQELTARLRWSNNKPGKVVDVSVDHPRLKAEVIEEQGQQLVKLTVPAGFDNVRPRYSVKVTTDDSSVPELTIPVYTTRPRSTSPVRRSTSPPQRHVPRPDAKRKQ